MKKKPEETHESISNRLKNFGKKPIKEKKEAVEIEDSSPKKTKRTFYLSHYSNSKLNRINAKMLVKGEKTSLSDIIEKAIDSLYDIEMSERAKNFKI